MENLLGKVFGKLKVIGEPIKGIRPMWLCECACGKQMRKRRAELNQGRASGCHSCNNGWKLGPFESKYHSLKSSCASRNMEFALSYEQYLEFTNQHECHYCGEPIVWKAHSDQGSGYKLDRKDNSIGYTVENCVVCCKRCNIGKNRLFSYTEWLAIGALIRSWKK